jgi:hypothetical protein
LKGLNQGIWGARFPGPRRLFWLRRGELLPENRPEAFLEITHHRSFSV